MTTKKPKIATSVEVDELSIEIPTEEDMGSVSVITSDEEADDAIVAVDDAVSRGSLPIVSKTEDVGVADDVPVFDVAGLITDVNDNIEHLTWLIYGKNGTGKTTLLSTVDGMLIMAAEDGTLSIRDKAKNAKKIRIDVWDKVEAVYWLLKNGRRKDGGIEISLPGGSKFLVKSIGFDTLTKLAQVCLRSVVLGERAKDASKDVVTPTQRDWGIMSQRMQYWLGLFKELPIQKVWLCQERANAEDLESEEYSIFPDLNKALKTYVQSEADVIGRTYIKKISDSKVQFRMLIGPNAIAVTKDRTNKLGYAIANPRLDKMYESVFGGE